MSLLQRCSVPLVACRLMAATAFRPARAAEPAQDEGLAAAPTHVQFTRQELAPFVLGTRSPSTADAPNQLDRVPDRSHLMPPGAVGSVLKGMKAAGDFEHNGSIDPFPEIRSERGDLSPIDASQPKTDLSGLQQQSSLIAGSGRRGR